MGGRARTENIDGFYFNQGPHALYLAGAGAKILRELGVKYIGNPPPSPQYLIKHGIKYKQTSSLSSILTTKLLRGLGNKIELIRFFASLNKMNFRDSRYHRRRMAKEEDSSSRCFRSFSNVMSDCHIC